MRLGAVILDSPARRSPESSPGQALGEVGIEDPALYVFCAKD